MGYPNKSGPGHYNRYPQRRPNRTRINHEIRSEHVRVVGLPPDNGSRVMLLREALQLAQNEGLDLVEIVPDQTPPICRVIDYGKFKFQQEKKAKDTKKNQHIIQVKEIKLRPKIDPHDYEIKLKKAREFLEEGNKVKVSLRFRGREIMHSNLGMNVMNKMKEELLAIANVEKTPGMEGKQIIMVVAPKPGTVKRKPKKTDDDAPASAADDSDTDDDEDDDDDDAPETVPEAEKATGEASKPS